MHPRQCRAHAPLAHLGAPCGWHVASGELVARDVLERLARAEAVGREPWSWCMTTIEAERSLLGGLLLDPEQFAEVAKLVRSRDFSSSDYAALFEAISALYRAGELIECHTLRDLDVLDLDVPSASRLGFYAEIISDNAQRRRVIEAASRIAQLGDSWHGSTSEFCVEAERRMRAAAARVVADAA